MNKVRDYQNLELIALGGMAEVYKGEKLLHDGGKKYFAIKKIRPQFAQDLKMQQMMLEEAKIVQRLDHPNIVQLYDFVQENEQLYLVFQYIDGITLFELFEYLLQSKRLIPWQVCVHVISEALKGLEYAHQLKLDGKQLNIKHRDISPQNILISKDGLVKLADFGIAKSEFDQSKTDVNIIKGKINYIAPEQITDRHSTPLSDLYSMAVVLCELISGQNPFAHSRETQMVRNISEAKYTKQAYKRKETSFPDKLYNLIEVMMSKHPNNRLQSANAFRNALLDLQEDIWIKNGSILLKSFLEKVSVEKIKSFSESRQDTVLKTLSNQKYPVEKENKTSLLRQLAYPAAACLLLFLSSKPNVMGKQTELIQPTEKNTPLISTKPNTIIAKEATPVAMVKQPNASIAKKKKKRRKSTTKKYGHIDVNGPLGSSVYINGKKWGTVPLKTKLEKGSYLVWIAPENQTAQMTRVQIMPNREYVLRWTK